MFRLHQAGRLPWSACWRSPGSASRTKLGSRTLFQHLRAIGQTKESQELVDGTRQVAGPLVDDVRRRVGQGRGRATGRRRWRPTPARRTSGCRRPSSASCVLLDKAARE